MTVRVNDPVELVSVSLLLPEHRVLGAYGVLTVTHVGTRAKRGGGKQRYVVAADDNQFEVELRGSYVWRIARSNIETIAQPEEA